MFSNGTLTEVTSDDVPENAPVVTNVNVGGKQPVRATGSPLFMMQPGGGRGR
jgi:hypothetical protein